MGLDHSAPLVEIDLHPGRFRVRGLNTGWRLRHPVAVGAVGSDIEPGQGRDVEAFCHATMAAVPEAIEAIGLLATFGDETGIHD